MSILELKFTWFGKVINIYNDPWFRFYRVIKLIERRIPILPDSKWLDVGCQVGQLLKLLQHNYGIVPTGIDDYNEVNVVEICKKHLNLIISSPSEVLNDTWSYFTRRIDEVGFDISEKYDFISALEIIEHMVDTDAFFSECRTHLKDSGYLIISTPNINSLRNRVQVLFGIYPSGLEYKTVNHHVRLYNLKTLVAHAAEHGFSLVDASGVNFFPRHFMKYSLIRNVDSYLSDRFPSFCGGLIALFKVRT